MIAKQVALDEAWVIGLFEGEGSITFDLRDRGNRVNIGIMMTDRDVVRRAYEIMGVGYFYGPYKHKDFKPTWRWSVTSGKDVEVILNRWLPYLGERRKQKATIGLERLKKLGFRGELRKTCRLRGHPFTPENTYTAPGTNWRMCKTCRAIRLPNKYKQDRELLAKYGSTP